MSFTGYITSLVNGNPGKTVGSISGLIFGILILTFGFWKTVVIILFVALGLVIGKMVDDGDSVIDTIRNLFRRK